MRKGKRKLLAAVVLMAVMAAGCGAAKNGDTAAGNRGETEKAVEQTENDGKAEEKDGVVVVMGPSSEPEAGFDPAYGWGAGEHVHEPLIQSTLTVTTTDLKIGFDLAENMDVTEDGLTWTVKIRDDVFFTDGKKLTAKDVAFTYNILRDTSSVNDFTMLEEAQAMDDATVVFHMKRAYSIWPYTMAIVGIVPEHAYGPDYGEHPIGSGRYLLKQWDRGQQVILEANLDYYGKAPIMKKVTVLFMDEDAALAAVQAGAVDLAYTAAPYSDLSIPGYELLAFDTVDNRGFNLPAIPSGSVSEEGVPLGNDFTSDKKVRRAINMGINREEMIDHVLNGYGSPAYSVCDKMPWYEPSAKIEYDPEGAEALLDEAGWILGKDGIREKDGNRAELSFVYPAGDSVRQALASDTVNQLKKIGIDGTTEGAGWDTAYDQAQSQPLMWGWGAHTPMELYNIYHTMEKTGLASYSPYTNEKVDQYMDAALSESNLEKSYELWKKAQWDGESGITQSGDIPWIWLVNIDHLYWAREELEVADQKLHPHGHGWSIVNNVDQWSWN